MEGAITVEKGIPVCGTISRMKFFLVQGVKQKK